MTKQVLLFFALLSATLGYSQYSITGKITSESNAAVGNATITAKQKNRTNTTVASVDGRFEIKGLKNGSYELIVSTIGYETSYERVVINNADQVLNLMLVAKSAQLQEVEVIGRSARKYNSDYSFAATKTATFNKEIPLSIGTVTKELITDRQAFQLADAVKIIPGVVPSSVYNQYAIRGISQNEEGQIINGLRTRQYYFIQPITANIERVEVIKGPASASFSSVDPGGSINMG